MEEKQLRTKYKRRWVYITPDGMFFMSPKIGATLITNFEFGI